MRPLRIPSTDSQGDAHLRRLLRRVASVPFVTPGTFAELARLPLDRAVPLLELSSQGYAGLFNPFTVLVDPRYQAIPHAAYTLWTVAITAAFPDEGTFAITVDRAHALAPRYERTLAAVPMGSREWHAGRFLGLLTALVTAVDHVTLQVTTWHRDPAFQVLGLPFYAGVPDGYVVLRRQGGGVLEAALLTIDNPHQVAAVGRDLRRLLRCRSARPSAHPLHVLIWAATSEVETALRDHLRGAGSEITVPVLTTNGALLPLSPYGISALNPGMTALRLGQEVWAPLAVKGQERTVWLPLVPPG